MLNNSTQPGHRHASCFISVWHERNPVSSSRVRPAAEAPKQSISCQLVGGAPPAVRWCVLMWLIRGQSRAFTCCRLPHPICCYAVRSSNPIFACLSLPPRGAPVIHKSLQLERKRAWGLWSFSGPELAEESKRSAFVFGLGRFRSISWKCWIFFWTSCGALGWSEQMLPQCFSLSSTPTYHLLHQSPSTPISSASFTSDPQSRPSICCTDLRQCCLWRHLTPGIYN